MSRFLASFAALAVCVCGCRKAPEQVPAKAIAVAEPTILDDNAKNLVRGNTEFALSLYDRLRTTPGNPIFSPYSISAALAMTYDGARGETAQEMANVLRFPPDRKLVPPAFFALHNNLTARSDGVELNIANALWGQKNRRFEPEFLATMGKHYGASFHFVDFIGDKEGARNTINRWTKRETNERIPEILKSGDVNGLTRLVLTNAIFLKGQWDQVFDKDRTIEEPFQRSPKDTVIVKMMFNSDGKFCFAFLPDVELLELPFRASKLSFVILLPSPTTSLAEFEMKLTAANLSLWIGSTKLRELSVSLPRLKIESGCYLKEALRTMRMIRAFDDRLADFSGTTTEEKLVVDKVIHKATFDLDEGGAVAAAATAGVARVVSAPPHFNANRPFLFLIRDRETGSILFMGRVIDPSKAG